MKILLDDKTKKNDLILLKDNPEILKNPIELLHLLTPIELYVLREFFIIPKPLKRTLDTMKTHQPVSVGKIHSNIATIAYKITQNTEPPKTINQTKDELAKLQITIPSFNRIKRILHTFKDWGVITSRKGTGKASEYYILTTAFREHLLDPIKIYMMNNNDKISTQEDLIAEYIRGEDY